MDPRERHTIYCNNSIEAKQVMVWLETEWGNFQILTYVTLTSMIEEKFGIITNDQ